MESRANSSAKEGNTCNKGNYKGYYKMRSNSNNRLDFLSETWFRGKTCLDVGCNDGQFCIALAETFGPAFILGIDPDFVLIDSAQSRVKRLVYAHNQSTVASASKTLIPTSVDIKPKLAPVAVFRSGFLPRSLAVKAPAKSASTAKVTAPIAATTTPSGETTTAAHDTSNSTSIVSITITSTFPHNVVFKARDFFDLSCTLSSQKEGKYDVVTCFSVTKWVHLTGSDDRLLEMFCRLYSLVRVGGRVVIEYQPWKSYENNKSTSDVTKAIFPTIRIKPDLFEWVLTFIVGFEIESRSGVHLDHAKGFDRPILVLRRPINASSGVTSSAANTSTTNVASSSANNETSKDSGDGNANNKKNKTKNKSAVGNATDGLRDGKKLWENVGSFSDLSNIVYKRIQRGTAASISGGSTAVSTSANASVEVFGSRGGDNSSRENNFSSMLLKRAAETDEQERTETKNVKKRKL